MYNKKEISSVWCNFRQMKNYVENVVTVFEEAEEHVYTDGNSTTYFDATSNMLSSNLGHGKKKFIDALIEQYYKLDSCSLYQETSSINIEYTNYLLGKMDSKYKHIFFTNSGSEACDTSIKIAKKYFYNQGCKKEKIVSLVGSYHGSTIAANMLCKNSYDSKYLDIIDNNTYLQVAPPLIRNCPKNSSQYQWAMDGVDQLKRIFLDNDNNIAAIIVEPLQLSNGAATISKEYFQELYKICKENNTLLIMDEIATGFGYTGTLFAYEQLSVKPDMILVAKSMTNGIVPLGGVITTEEIYHCFLGQMDEYKELPHGFTTSGSPLGCAVGLEVLKYIEENNILANVNDTHKYLRKLFNQLTKFSFVKNIDGLGFIVGILLDDSIKVARYPDKNLGMLIEGMLKRKGLLVYYEGEGKMILAFPIEVEKIKIDAVYKRMNKVFSLVNELIEN